MFKPMLSATIEDVGALRFPLLASWKLDGIRALVVDGVLVSRNMKPIRNAAVQERFGHRRFNGLDGELVVGPANAPDIWSATASGVTSAAGDPDVWFHVFDCFAAPRDPFQQRQKRAASIAALDPRIHVVPQTVVTSLADLVGVEGLALRSGYEGLMLRDADAPYKFGRGTMTAQDLMKLKRFADAEAVVNGVEERQRNNNEATLDALGRTKRSTAKAGKTGAGELGTFLVRGTTGPYAGLEFRVGPGVLTERERLQLWEDRGALLGRTLTFKYFPTGSKEAPRFPTFLRWRADADL